MVKILLIVFIFINLASCQSAKDALTLKKKNSSDEFLVEKKSPLVLPPDYGQLPQPKEINSDQLKKEDNLDNDIQNLLIKSDVLNKKTLKDTEPTPLEKSILKKVN